MSTLEISLVYYFVVLFVSIISNIDNFLDNFFAPNFRVELCTISLMLFCLNHWAQGIEFKNIIGHIKL